VLSFGASERPAFAFTGTDIMARRAVRTSPVRTFGPDDLIRDVCGAVQDTECVIVAE
jgi:hypothetical protein